MVLELLKIVSSNLTANHLLKIVHMLGFNEKNEFRLHVKGAY